MKKLAAIAVTFLALLQAASAQKFTTLFPATGCSASAIASIPLGTFTLATGTNASVVTNADSTPGVTATNFATMQAPFTAPLDCVYTFTVNAFQTANPGVLNQNQIEVFVDSEPIPATGASVANNWTQLVTNSSPAQGYQFSAPVQAGKHNVVVGFNIGQSAALVAATQGVHGDRLIIAQTATSLATEPPGSRDGWNFPFSSYSYLNSAIGSGAQWSSGSTAADISYQAGAGSTFVNYNSFTNAYTQGQSTDPIGSYVNTLGYPQMLYNGTVQLMFHISESTVIAPGTDHSGVVGDATNPRYMYSGSNNMTFAAGPPPAINAGIGSYIDMYSQNPALYTPVAIPAGQIRVADINAGVIAHTLQLGTFYTQMLAPANTIQGMAWPNAAVDYACAATGPPTSCTGSLPWGSTLGIPSTVNCNSLGLSVPYGVMLCVALQNYGAVHTVNTGSSATAYLYGEYAPGNSTFQTAMAAIQTAWATSAIQSNMRILINNTPSNFFAGGPAPNLCSPLTGCVKGGGTPRVPMLPGLVKNLPAIDPTPQPTPAQAPFKLAGMSYGNASGACLTTTKDAPAHSTLFFMGVQQNAFTGSFSGATDTNGNTWHVAVQITNAAVPTPAILYTINTANDLPSGSHICVNGSFNGGTWAGDAWAATGVVGGLDVTNSQFNNISNHGFSFTSPTLGQNNELVLFMFNGQTNLGTINEGLSGIEMQDGIFSGGTYFVATAGGTVTYTPSWSGNASASTALVATFKIP